MALLSARGLRDRIRLDSAGEVKLTLTTRHFDSSLAFDSDRSIFPPVHLDDIRLCADGTAKVGGTVQTHEEHRRAIGVFRIQLLECVQVAMVVVVV